ncbi:hypothetical protein [Rhizobium sp. Rhizsp82]|uniref:hypothetical protein n=1 Tax=Rhizobium sp. Rhizsp82 TaxID=3243057 RepID=UPI0039B3759E
MPAIAAAEERRWIYDIQGLFVVLRLELSCSLEALTVSLNSSLIAQPRNGSAVAELLAQCRLIDKCALHVFLPPCLSGTA